MGAGDGVAVTGDGETGVDGAGRGVCVAVIPGVDAGSHLAPPTLNHTKPVSAMAAAKTCVKRNILSQNRRYGATNNLIKH